MTTEPLSAIAERDALRRFAQEVMEAWPEGGIEGDDLQEIAVEHGLLAKVLKFQPCGDNCACADSRPDPDEWDEGVTCYRRTALLNGE